MIAEDELTVPIGRLECVWLSYSVTCSVAPGQKTVVNMVHSARPLAESFTRSQVPVTARVAIRDTHVLSRFASNSP